MALLEVADITVGYGEVPILQQVSMQVNAGEVVAIVGPNGAGKSTLMKTVAGLLKPRAGTDMLRGPGPAALAPAPHCTAGHLLRAADRQRLSFAHYRRKPRHGGVYTAR